jgi:hypothetical protein
VKLQYREMRAFLKKPSKEGFRPPGLEDCDGADGPRAAPEGGGGWRGNMRAEGGLLPRRRLFDEKNLDGSEKFL